MLSLERQQSSGRSLFVTFYIRRWFRLYPLSMFFVLLVYFSPLASDDDNRWTGTALFANLSLTQNILREEDMIGVLWTLPLEVQMYALLPFLFVGLLHKSWWWSTVIWGISLPLASVSLLGTDRFNIFEYIPCFLGGILAWKISRHYRPIFHGWLWPLGIAGVSLVWFCAENIYLYDLPLRWIFCAMLGMIIPMFRSMGDSVVTRGAAIIAKYSYGIYLSHTIAMAIAFHSLAGKDSTVQWGVFLLLATTIPYLAFHLIESPMIDLGKRIARSVDRRSMSSHLSIPSSS
jgi:peptidoglycan/LPS O-acetylase OafA/YrhL